MNTDGSIVNRDLPAGREDVVVDKGQPIGSSDEWLNDERQRFVVGERIKDKQIIILL